MGETTSSGVVGCPSRMVSRKPCTAGAKARRRIRSVLTRLMPILTLIRSAGVSRRARAVNGSSRALPPNPRLTSSTPPSEAASAGQVVVGLVGVGAVADRAAVVQPHLAVPDPVPASTGASVRRATSSVISLCGSQISTSLTSAGRPVNRSGADRTGPGVGGPGGHVDGADVAAGRAGPPGEPAVDEQVVDAVGTGRGALVGHLGGEHVQLDGRWPGCGGPAVRRRAGPRPWPAGRRGTARAPGRAAGAAARRARCAPGRGRRAAGPR